MLTDLFSLSLHQSAALLSLLFVLDSHHFTGADWNGVLGEREAWAGKGNWE